MVLQVETIYDFDGYVDKAKNRLIVVDFFSTWCGPCKLIAPYIQELSEEYKDEVVFISIDVEEQEELAECFNISALPTFILLKNKAKVDEMSGINETRIKAMIDKHK